MTWRPGAFVWDNDEICAAETSPSCSRRTKILISMLESQKTIKYKYKKCYCSETKVTKIWSKFCLSHPRVPRGGLRLKDKNWEPRTGNWPHRTFYYNSVFSSTPPWWWPSPCCASRRSTQWPRPELIIIKIRISIQSSHNLSHAKIKQKQLGEKRSNIKVIYLIPLFD